MSPQRGPHSKKVWFDELYLSWVQLSEIMATWWEIRAVPCCAVLGGGGGAQLWKHSRFSSHTGCLKPTALLTPLWLNGRKQNRTLTRTLWWILISPSPSGQWHNCSKYCYLLTAHSITTVLSSYKWVNIKIICVPLSWLMEATGQHHNSNYTKRRLRFFCCCHHTARIGLQNLFPECFSSGENQLQASMPQQVHHGEERCMPRRETH